MSIAVSKLSKKTVEFIIEKVRNYITKMTGNLSYTTPNPTLASIKTENDKLEVDFNAALDGGKTLKKAVRLQRLKVMGMAFLLKANVQPPSLEDEWLIFSSGFD